MSKIARVLALAALLIPLGEHLASAQVSSVNIPDTVALNCTVPGGAVNVVAADIAAGSVARASMVRCEITANRSVLVRGRSDDANGALENAATVHLAPAEFTTAAPGTLSNSQLTTTNTDIWTVGPHALTPYFIDFNQPLSYADGPGLYQMTLTFTLI